MNEKITYECEYCGYKSNDKSVMESHEQVCREDQIYLKRVWIRQHCPRYFAIQDEVNKIGFPEAGWCDNACLCHPNTRCFEHIMLKEKDVIHYDT